LNSPVSLGSHARTIAGRREQNATRTIFFFSGLAMSSWAPLVPFAKARLEIDEGTLGVLLLCLGLGSIAAMPLAGIVTTRLGCRIVNTIAAVSLALVIPILSVANTVALLAVAITAFGASVGAMSVASNVQAVMVEKDSRRHMMSGFHGLFSIGGFIGSGSISLLVSIGTVPLMATLTMSTTLIMLLFVAWRGMLPYGNHHSERAPLIVMPHGIVVFLGALCFVVFLTEGAMLDWSAVFLNSVHNLDRNHAGLGYTTFAIAMAIGRFSGDWAVKTFGGTRVVVAGGVLGAIGLFIAVAAPVPTMAFGGFFLIGLGVSNLVPLFYRAVGRQDTMPPSLAVASITAIGYSGILLGPAGIGFVARHIGLSASFVILGCGLVVVAVAGIKIGRSDTSHA